MTVAVDHAVVNVLQEMNAAAARFAALGFTLTERGYHSLGSINHLMMFERDYLELVGIESNARTVRREVADSPLGLNGLVFRTADAGLLHDTLTQRGIPVLAPIEFDRPVEAEGRTRRAVFTTVRVDPQWLSGGRVYFCEHKTPELVWQPQWQHHVNGADALAGFTIVVPSPADEGARYGCLLGCEISTDANGDVVVRLGGFVVVLCTAASYRDRFGDFGCSESRIDRRVDSGRSAFMGALAIRTVSLGNVRACLLRPEARAVQWRAAPDRITIAAASAYDCAIEFVE